MADFRVVITDFIHDDLHTERGILDGLARVDALNAFDEAELQGRIEDADAVMLYHNLGISAATIDRLGHCKLIVRCGVGFDNVDRKRARERGIPVVNVPDYGSEEVADTALGMLLSVTRGIHFLNQKLQKAGGEWTYLHAAPIYRIRGRVCGVVGLGRIGIAFALRAKALGMRVLFYDPFAADGLDKALGITRCETLEEMLKQSYAVSIHAPLNDGTRHMINAETLALMPKGGYLVNTARGAVVDVSCLVPALESGQLAGAGIDVLPHEPPLEGDPLLKAWRDPNHPAHDRLILNPHSAFYSEEGLTDMRVKGAQACRNALTGKPLRNVVN